MSCESLKHLANLQLADSLDEQLSMASSSPSPDVFAEQVALTASKQTSRKRKRHSSEDPDHLATPGSSVAFSEVSELWEHSGISIPKTALLFSSKSNHRFFELSMDAKRSAKLVGNDEKFVQLAQKIADQAISSTNIVAANEGILIDQCAPEITQTFWLIEAFEETSSTNFGRDIKRCTIKDLLGFDDQDQSTDEHHQGNVLQKPQKPRFPNRASPTLAQMLSKLPIPDVCIQRSNTSIDIAPSALHFWEELSLAPAHGSKDITAFCVFPAKGNKPEVATFLDMIKDAYQSCKLGMHELGSDRTMKRSPFFSILDDNSSKTREPSFPIFWEGNPPEGNEDYFQFGSMLGSLKLEGGNTVIYMVNPSNDEASFPLLCSAFLEILNAYKVAIRESDVNSPNDLVLQIIPSNMIYSSTEICLPSPTQYRRLALEVYDRCAPSQEIHQRSKWQFVCAPSIRLAKAVPKSIDFRLTPENPLSLQSDNCLHVAYTWNWDEDWLTASWTDNLGTLSWTACYPFINAGNAIWQTFSEIANEIWESTLGMLQSRGGPWRILLCKDGSVYKHEMDGEHPLTVAFNIVSNIVQLGNQSSWEAANLH